MPIDESQIQLRGKDTNASWSSDGLLLDVTIVSIRPYLQSDATVFDTLEGRIVYKKRNLVFDIECYPFSVDPLSTVSFYQDHRRLLALQELLAKPYIGIIEIGTRFKRITQATIGLQADGKVPAYPIICTAQDLGRPDQRSETGYSRLRFELQAIAWD